MLYMYMKILRSAVEDYKLGEPTTMSIFMKYSKHFIHLFSYPVITILKSTEWEEETAYLYGYDRQFQTIVEQEKMNKTLIQIKWNIKFSCLEIVCMELGYKEHHSKIRSAIQIQISASFFINVMFCIIKDNNSHVTVHDSFIVTKRWKFLAFHSDIRFWSEKI